MLAMLARPARRHRVGVPRTTRARHPGTSRAHRIADKETTMTFRTAAPAQEHLARFLEQEVARQANQTLGPRVEPAAIEPLIRPMVADLLRTRPTILDFGPELAVRRIRELLLAAPAPAAPSTN
jgi:hypothetical protein